MEKDSIRDLILTAFSKVNRPGNWALVDNREGDEPLYVEEEFQDKDDWRTIDPAFLEEAPKGFRSALSFFSNEAFRYFLPAYLIADLDGKLYEVDPSYYLCSGLDNASKNEKVNPRRFGDQTWLHVRQWRFSLFTKEEAKAILEYLKYKSAISTDFSKQQILEAIENYWDYRAK